MAWCLEPARIETHPVAQLDGFRFGPIPESKTSQNIFRFVLYACWMVLSTLGLRTYPPRFGLKLVRLFPRFIFNKEALRVTGEPHSESQSLFKSLEWGNWWDLAGMPEAFLYLRGSVDLQLGNWRPLFPEAI